MMRAPGDIFGDSYKYRGGKTQSTSAERRAAHRLDSPANCRISVTGRAPGWCSSRHTQLKNRIHATWATYALHDLDVSDLFGAPGRDLLRPRLPLQPPHTA